MKNVESFLPNWIQIQMDDYIREAAKIALMICGIMKIIGIKKLCPFTWERNERQN